MKKILALIIILVLLLPMSCAKKEKDELTALVPADTQFYFKIASLTSLHQSLSVTENSIMGKPIPNIAFLESGLGFNPLKLEDLQAQGIDINRSLALFLYDIEINSINNKLNNGIKIAFFNNVYIFLKVPLYHYLLAT